MARPFRMSTEYEKYFCSMYVYQRSSNAEGPLNTQVNKITSHLPCILKRLQVEVTMVPATGAMYGFNNMHFSQRLTGFQSIMSTQHANSRNQSSVSKMTTFPWRILQLIGGRGITPDPFHQGGSNDSSSLYIFHLHVHASCAHTHTHVFIHFSFLQPFQKELIMVVIFTVQFPGYRLFLWNCEYIRKDHFTQRQVSNCYPAIKFLIRDLNVYVMDDNLNALAITWGGKSHPIEQQNFKRLIIPCVGKYVEQEEFSYIANWRVNWHIYFGQLFGIIFKS